MFDALSKIFNREISPREAQILAQRDNVIALARRSQPDKINSTRTMSATASARSAINSLKN